VDEHAALVETSLMLAIAPHLVRLDKIADDSRKNPYEFRIFPWNRANYPASGVFAATSGASLEKGEALIAVVIQELERLLKVVFSPYRR
jgi:creatinine amidohydrolase